MGQIGIRNWNFREFRVQVNWSSSIQQVWIPIQSTITPMRGLSNRIRQVVPLITDIRSYPPHHSHLNPPSLPVSSQLYHYRRTQRKVISLYLSVSWPWVDTEYSIHRVQHTLRTAYTEYSIHWVPPTPSTAYTEYSIHRVQHTPSTASTQDCLLFLHSYDHKLTPERCFSFWCASLHDGPPSPSSPSERHGKVILSHSHGCELTNWWMESQQPVRSPLTASQYSSILARVWLPSLHDHGRQIHLETRTSTASKLTWSRPRSVCPCSLDYWLQVCTIFASECNSYLTR